MAYTKASSWSKGQGLQKTLDLGEEGVRGEGEEKGRGGEGRRDRVVILKVL